MNSPLGRVSSGEVRYELPAWSHFVWLIYLTFLFTPLLGPARNLHWLWPTLATIPIAIWMYVRVILKLRHTNPPGDAALPEVLVIALTGYALAPFNDSANTYIVYCVAMAPFAGFGWRRLALFVVLMLGGYALELGVLGFKPLLFGITTIIALVSGVSNYMMLENRRHNLALRLASEEVHRMARVAERERIGRDLHDLLGHTLSLIAIKSELAAKLLDRDRVAAGREITEVMNVAREALKQVRTAVSGIRSAALEGEIASARALLETSGVGLLYERDGTVLPAEVETTLAMIVREAVTNIQRHAGARQARIEVALDEGAATGAVGIGAAIGRVAGDWRPGTGEKAILLLVTDDGRGGIAGQGNGLAGIRERVKSLGGTLEIESPRGGGTSLRVRIPMRAPPVSIATAAAPAPPAGTWVSAEPMGLDATLARASEAQDLAASLVRT